MAKVPSEVFVFNTSVEVHYLTLKQVQLRKKRADNSPRPWSVSCLSQLSGAGTSLVTTPTASDVAAMSHNMSISESALNTLASPQRVTPANSNSKLRGSSTTVQVYMPNLT